MPKRFDDVIFVRFSENEMPDPGSHCIVSGGIAIWDGKNWLSMMEKPHRKIVWEVHWWSYVPNGYLRPNDPVSITIDGEP